jgi:hypothetical protein
MENPYVEYLKSIAKKPNTTRDKFREAGRMTPTDMFTLDASHQFPPDFLEELGKTNASSSGFLPSPGTPDPLYFRDELTAAGYTYPKGHPLAGQVVLAGNHGPARKVKTFAHENYHSRVQREGKGLKPAEGGSVPAGALGDTSYFKLRERMHQIANPEYDVSKWGTHPGRSPEELIANLTGYEGGLPKGTNILDDEVGKQLFHTNGKVDPKLRDYYFTQSSIPYGGIWEGQAPERSKLEEFTRKLKKKLRF